MNSENAAESTYSDNSDNIDFDVQGLIEALIESLPEYDIKIVDYENG